VQGTTLALLFSAGLGVLLILREQGWRMGKREDDMAHAAECGDHRCAGAMARDSATSGSRSICVSCSFWRFSHRCATSDNSVRILRLSYAAYGTATASEDNAIPIDTEPVSGVPQSDFQQVQAVSLIQIPPSPFSISGWFVRRPLNVFCWFGIGRTIQQYVQSGAAFVKTALDVPTGRVP